MTAWASSNRKARLPSNWEQLRRIVKDRAGGRCEHWDQGQRCTTPGTDCDHVTRGDDHSLANLQWLCSKHHKDKTQREAAQARAGRRRTPPLRRPSEAHPGLT